MARLVWDGENVKRRIKRDVLRKRLSRAAAALSVHAKEALGTPSPPPSVRGDYPHKDTGHLRRNIAWEWNPETFGARWGIGENVPYGKMLEFGTRRMAARPWMWKTNTAMAGEVRRMIETPMYDREA
jgi:HK97 gp10 family phage protein